MKEEMGTKDEKEMLSIIIPVYNEAQSLQELYAEISAVMAAIGNEYELIFVDDGSTDKTMIVLSDIRAKDSNVKIIQFRRNYGKSAVLSAGFKSAVGEIIITMDGDLQDMPSEIHKFIDKINEGYDLVSGWKYSRKDPFSKRIASKIFNIITSLITGIKIHDFNCGFKAYRKELAKDIDIYGELYRYLPVIAQWKGYKIGEIKVEHRYRRYGKSKYGMERYSNGFFDLLTIIMLTRYMRKPLHLFGGIGLISSLIGFIVLAYLVLLKIFTGEMGHEPLLMLGILLAVLGIQFISIGLLGEMIATTTRQKQEYLIRGKSD